MAAAPTSILPRRSLLAVFKRESVRIQVSPKLTRSASLEPRAVLLELETTLEGLSEEEAAKRLDEVGPNIVAQEERFTQLRILLHACLNPLVILLSVLAIISFATAETFS